MNDVQLQTMPMSQRETAFRARMVAQIRHIERYRLQQWLQFGRRLSRNEAAAEWIVHFAADFPDLATL